MEAMHKLADREIKAGRMLDNGGLMPLATGAQVRIKDGRLSVDRRPVRGGQGGDRRLRDLRTAATRKRRMAMARRIHAAAQGLHAGLGRDMRGSRSSRAAAVMATAPGRAVGGHDGRRHPSRDPRGLADRAAAADHQPGADAARCAAGRGFDAGSAAGGARALARDRRSGKARRVADGDRQAPGARSSAPRPDARAQARAWSRATWSRSSRPCPIWTPRWTTTSATSCCG